MKREVEVDPELLEDRVELDKLVAAALAQPTNTALRAEASHRVMDELMRLSLHLAD